MAWGLAWALHTLPLQDVAFLPYKSVGCRVVALFASPSPINALH